MLITTNNHITITTACERRPEAEREYELRGPQTAHGENNLSTDHTKVLAK